MVREWSVNTLLQGLNTRLGLSTSAPKPSLGETMMVMNGKRFDFHEVEKGLRVWMVSREMVNS